MKPVDNKNNDAILYDISSDVIYDVLKQQMPDTMAELEKAMSQGMPVEYITKHANWEKMSTAVQDNVLRALRWKMNKINAAN